MIISAIVGVDKNNIIGSNNKIPWYLPEDLKYFKRITLNHHIIMGRKNFESIGRPLPRRTNIILTRDPFYMVSGCVIAHSIEEALTIAYSNGDKEAFIIGGGEIYKQSIHLLDKIYLTQIDVEVEGDVYFPKIDKNAWILTSSEAHKADEKNKYDYNFHVYEKK